MKHRIDTKMVTLNSARHSRSIFQYDAEKETSGRIILLNQEKRSGAIRTENQEYTVFHLLSFDDLDVGDEIFGNLHSLGKGLIKNLTKESILTVDIADARCVVAAKAKRLVGN